MSLSQGTWAFLFWRLNDCIRICWGVAWLIGMWQIIVYFKCYSSKSKTPVSIVQGGSKRIHWLSQLYDERRFKAHASRLAFAFVVIVLEVAIVCHTTWRPHPVLSDREVGLSFSGIFNVPQCMNERQQIRYTACRSTLLGWFFTRTDVLLNMRCISIVSFDLAIVKESSQYLYFLLWKFPVSSNKYS